MTVEKKKGKKTWLTLAAAVAIASVQVLATAGVIPPVIANLLGGLSAALQPGSA
ncbi:hypothetical protein [Sphingopyxis lindanitolerans]|uniref:hypothetical protein n=1 Tax=Sphingopyxis lindanitolerans TaxID=2054227 RepID=UPI00130503F3|nr:hypothetical protein [Sphingopyxis lindanitolerans]